MQTDIIVYGIILLIILWALIEQRLLMTTKHTITSSRVPLQLNQTSFVLLADLHNRTFGKDNQRLIKKIEELSPEYILVAGDMINKRSSCYPSNAYTLIEELSYKYNVFYAYGNHEQRMEQLGKETPANRTSEDNAYYSTWVEFKKKLSKNNVIFLDNESVTLDIKGTKLKITGVSIDIEYFEFNSTKDMNNDYLNAFLGKSSKDMYQILIAHNPIYFRAYSDWGADLTLSGHLHGGMMRLPGIGGIISPQAKFFPKYDMGKHSHNKGQLIVSRGLGSHSIMPRLFNIPELIYFKLEKENK